MTGMTLGISALALTMLMLVLRIHIGVAMLAGGAACYYVANSGDLNALLFTLNNLAYSRLSNYDLAVIPLFVLMGQFATHGGLSRAIFRFAGAYTGNMKGGLGISALGACAGFGAICGSSLATSATMSKVALPELRRHGYPGDLSSATIAAGGTLGILIPPSVPLIVYAVLTQESIAKLFVAAVIPGLIAAGGYMIVIRLLVARESGIESEGSETSFATKLAATWSVIPVGLVFLVVIVGIYAGWANPTEAASIGAAACGILAFLQGNLRWQGLRESLLGTAQTAAMIFLVLLGADLLNSGLALSRMPMELTSWVVNSGLPPMLIVFGILVLYLILGCFMDSLAMILLTIPIFYPVIMELDIMGLAASEKSIWFGILALMVVEIGLITPPLGMNLFIVQRSTGDVSLMDISRRVIPFLASDITRIALLFLFPSISLFLIDV